VMACCGSCTFTITDPTGSVAEEQGGFRLLRNALALRARAPQLRKLRVYLCNGFLSETSSGEESMLLPLCAAFVREMADLRRVFGALGIDIRLSISHSCKAHALAGLVQAPEVRGTGVNPENLRTENLRTENLRIEHLRLGGELSRFERFAACTVDLLDYVSPMMLPDMYFLARFGPLPVQRIVFSIFPVSVNAALPISVMRAAVQALEGIPEVCIANLSGVPTTFTPASLENVVSVLRAATHICDSLPVVHIADAMRRMSYYTNQLPRLRSIELTELSASALVCNQPWLDFLLTRLKAVAGLSLVLSRGSLRDPAILHLIGVMAREGISVVVQEHASPCPLGAPEVVPVEPADALFARLTARLLRRHYIVLRLPGNVFARVQEHVACAGCIESSTDGELLLAAERTEPALRTVCALWRVYIKGL